jgi:hypothetical protein
MAISDEQQPLHVDLTLELSVNRSLVEAINELITTLERLMIFQQRADDTSLFTNNQPDRPFKLHLCESGGPYAMCTEPSTMQQEPRPDATINLRLNQVPVSCTEASCCTCRLPVPCTEFP